MSLGNNGGLHRLCTLKTSSSAYFRYEEQLKVPNDNNNQHKYVIPHPEVYDKIITRYLLRA